MSATFYDLLKFAKTGNAAPEMTQYDKMKALSMCKAGFPVKTLTGVPPIPFDSDGTPLIAWTVVGNEVQDGTPSPQNIVIPQECGDLVESGEHAGQYAVPITLAGQTQTVYLSEPLRKALDGSDAVDVLKSDGTLTRAVDSNGDALVTPTTETVTVPTLTPTKGSNTLTVNTTLPPSEVSITGGIREGV